MTQEASPDPSGDDLYALVEELYPICRSITGNGVRETLRILSRFVPVKQTEVESGTQVLDWTVPHEWNIRDAYIKNPAGDRVVDFRKSNLHVVNYSTPVRQKLALKELRTRLHSLPDQPELIPYRTSYYAETWGFCLSHRQLEALEETEYEVCIDSTLAPGSLTYGEFLVPGQVADEVLVSTHICHPSLCDDNLTGLSLSVHLARALMQGPRPRLSYRFLYAPGTIGAIAWLANNRDTVKRVKHGLTLTCLGDGHPFTYKRTVFGGADIDRAMAHVLQHGGLEHRVIDFFPYGYDERQYNSPGFRLPVGSLMRGRHGQFAEYHTSADNLEFVKPAYLRESYGVLWNLFQLLDQNLTYRNLEPYGEPQLGSRGLYRAMGGSDIPNLQLAMLWLLNLSDAKHTLLDIAERSGTSFQVLNAAARMLVDHGLLEVLS